MKTESGNRRMLVRAAALMVILCVVIGGTALYERRQRAQQEQALRKLSEKLKPTAWTEENTVVLDGETYGFDHRLETFLFIGTDASGNEAAEGVEAHGAMADYLLLMVLDHTENAIGYLQIDRNTITPVNELDANGKIDNIRSLQICTAHWYGHNPEMSAENTSTAVRTLLGELDSIDGYYVINMGDIGVLNRAVGGVTVTIDDDMTAVDSAFVPGATLTLSDDQAERFIRARVGVGNEDNAARMARQQKYMDGLFAKVRQRAAVDPKFSNELWKMLRSIAVTDMIGNDFSRIAQKLLKGEDRGILRLEGETRAGAALGDGKLHEEFYPSGDSILRTMTRLFSLVPVEDEPDDGEADADEDEEEDFSDDEDSDEEGETE